MRGSHYGTDARWFGRAFDVPGEVEIPELPREAKGAGDQKAERGGVEAVARFHQRQHAHQRLLGQVRNAGDGAEADRPRAGPTLSPLQTRLGGAFRRAIAQTGGEAAPARDPLPPALARLLNEGILKGTRPEDLALGDIDRLREALDRGGLRPTDGVRVMTAWARERRIPPEAMLDRLRALRDDWLRTADDRTPSDPSVALATVKDWDWEEEVASALGQRSNVGYGPKDVDHEKLRLLLMMLDSFAGQMNYGFAPPI